MKKLLPLIATLLLQITPLHAQDAQQTKRIPQFANDKVRAWKTIIYPTANQALIMHRHDHDRVVVALTDGLLKITNNKGETQELKLEKNKAYYFAKDKPNVLHNDVNLSNHAVKVMVIEFVS